MIEVKQHDFMDCEHKELQFGSGDYYIFCARCHSKWCLHNADQPEYAVVDGKPIGASPQSSVPRTRTFDQSEKRVLLAKTLTPFD